jgi:hypothetical protein
LFLYFFGEEQSLKSKMRAQAAGTPDDDGTVLLDSKMKAALSKHACFAA